MKGKEKGVSQGFWVMSVRERGKLLALHFSIIMKGFLCGFVVFP